MNQWFKLIVMQQEISALPDFMDYYDRELEEARKEVKIQGSLEKESARLPGYFEHRFAQLQEIEGVLEYFKKQEENEKNKKIRHFKEHYNTELSDRNAERYASTDPEVLFWSECILHIGVLHKQMLGVTKALDTKNFQIGHIIRLRTAGIEDATI